MKRKTAMNRTKDKMTTTKDRKRRSRQPVLRFSPTAWAKLLFFCHHGETEIGGFGLTPPDDVLMVGEFVTVRQSATCVSVAFDDGAVADFFDGQVDAGRTPSQFARIWLHTHPGDSPEPSGTDEETFARVFGRCDWAVLFILARGGEHYARLRFNAGPGGYLLVPVQVDFLQSFVASDHAAWEEEYTANIHPEPLAFNGLNRTVQRGLVFDELNGDDRTAVDLDVFGDEEDLMNQWERESEVWP